jgi:hypothetical protein
MSAFKELAQPAPTVGEAKAQAPSVSKSVIVEAADISEEPKIEAAPAVSGAVVGDYQKFAPKITPQQASILSVAELKKQGTDFEGEAGVIKGCVKKDIMKKILPFFYDERDFVSYGEVRRYVFVRGNCMFIYADKSDPRPLYVIEMHKFMAEIENPIKPDKYSFTISPQAGTNMPGSYFTTVLLKDKHSKKQSYQITFDTRNDKSLIKRFMDVMTINCKQYGGQVISASLVDEKMEKKSLS